MSLSAEDWAKLNSRDLQYMFGARRSELPQILKKLRKQYEGDNHALEQIDRFDPNSPYSRLMIMIRKCYVNGDDVGAGALENELNAKYPLSSNEESP